MNFYNEDIFVITTARYCDADILLIICEWRDTSGNSAQGKRKAFSGVRRYRNVGRLLDNDEADNVAQRDRLQLCRINYANIDTFNNKTDLVEIIG